MHDVFGHVLWNSSYKYGVFGKLYKYAYCALCNPAHPCRSAGATFCCVGSTFLELVQGFGSISQQMMEMHKTQENLADAINRHNSARQQDVELFMKVLYPFRPHCIMHLLPATLLCAHQP
jgi:hypothetical protein